MSNIRFNYNLLKNSLVEKDVENAYRQLFHKFFKNYEINSPFKCDGYLTTKELYKEPGQDEKEKEIKMLCEFKLNVNLKEHIDQIKIIIQSIYYLKKFENSGKKNMPNILFVGDINECFVMHTNPLLKYLDYDLNWNIAPSESYKHNPELINDLINDDKINPHVFDISDDFIWSAISRKIKDLSFGIKRLIKVNNKNIVNIFNGFCDKVLLENKNLNEHDKATLFIIKLINNKDIYLHPNKKNCLVTKDFGEINVNERNFSGFFKHVDGSQYSIKEKNELVKIVDRIVEDNQRRRNGDFFTPTIWVDEAHKMISEQFGEDWKEKYVVWDPAWGTGNLTRDYRFKELYASTLHKSEIDTALSNRVNDESTIFQYDFLNDGIIDGEINIENDDKLPQGLKDAILSGKEIIVFMNPPYGTSGNMGKGENKKGISNNLIKKIMTKDKFGNCTEQLYAQFLFKIIKYTEKYNSNINICLFSPPLFLSGNSFNSFRNKFFNYFNFKDGFLLNASEFADVSDSWGISFTIFKKEQTLNNTMFEIKIKKENEKIEIINIDNKLLYNTDNISSLNKWVRKYKISRTNLIEYPQVSSPLKVKERGLSGKIDKNAFGYIVIGSNKVSDNTSQIILSTATHTRGHGLSIVKNNFMDINILFTSRKLITSNWINQKDEYIAPTPEVEQSDKFKQFQYDSIVYSLFNTSSNQSSMRQVDYKDKKWDIKNEFFWISKEKIMDLADKNGFDDLYYDVKFSENRYVYNLLFEEEKIYDKLSDDAKEVLDLSIELVGKSFSFRKTLHESKPEYHLHAWDAGWYQIKLILKEYFTTEYVEFVDKYKKLENRLRPLVYELGFLK